MATLSTQTQQPTPGLASPNSNTTMIAGGSNSPSVQNATKVIDQLSGLLPLIWATQNQSISFPAVSFKEESSHDLAIHKYPNIDAARIENTGRNPSVYHVRAILTNNIFPGPNETWIHGSLFPQVFNNLLSVFLTDSQSANPGILQHPFLGNITCRVQGWSYDFVGVGPRDGVYMDIVFVETIGSQPLLQTVSINSGSSITQLNAVSNQMDNEVTDGFIPNNIPGNNPSYPLPLSPPGLQLTGFFSTCSLQIGNFVGAPNQILPSIGFPIYNSANTSLNSVTQIGQNQSNISKGSVLNATVNSLVTYNQAALNAVYSTSYSLNNSANNNPAQLINNTIYFYSALITYYKSFNQVGTAKMENYLYQAIQLLQQVLGSQVNNNQGYAIEQYQVNVPTSLVALTRLLNNSVDQLIALNPNMENYLIPASTVINYFQG